MLFFIKITVFAESLQAFIKFEDLYGLAVMYFTAYQMCLVLTHARYALV